MIHLALWIVSFVIVVWAVVAGFALIVATWFIWLPLVLLIVTLALAYSDHSQAAIVPGFFLVLSLMAVYAKFRPER